jgi:hypothetical protein
MKRQKTLRQLVSTTLIITVLLTQEGSPERQLCAE